jgi:hypothetical protein
MPRLTQSEIHSDFSSASETWSEYRAQVIAFYDNYPHGELNDHITREFNKKIRDLGQAESLYISPYNAGLRYIGDGVFTVDPLSFNPYFYIDAASSMLGVLESPSLDLNPAVSSTLDIITATRAGTATYTDASGNIQTASPNTVRVDHVQGEELTPTKFQRVGYTDFSSGWGVHNGATVSGTGSYNGEVSKQITAVGYSTYHTSIATTPNSSYTLSFYARLISGSNSSISIYSQHTETAFTNISLTSEWQRFDVAVTASGSSINFGIAKTAGATDPVVFEISQPQFEEGTTASSFVENTTGSPKFITGPTFGPRVPMILVEPSSENLVRMSEDFSNNIWVKNDTSVVSGQLSPSGNETAHLIKGSTNSSRHNVVHGLINYTVTGSFSLFAKAKELRYLQIASANTSSQYANFDLLSGTIGTVASDFSNATIETYPDGWYRITVVSPNKFNAYYISLVSGLTAGWLESWVMPNNTDGLYIWGAQLEAGSVATSYIPTSGSAVTRAADDLVIDGSDFTDFYNQSEGTFYCEFQTKDATAFYYLLNSQSDQARFFYSNGGTNIINSFDGTTATGLTNLQDNTLSRVALSIKASEFKASKDGSSEAVASHNGNLLTVPTELRIGKSPYNAVPLQLNGHIKRLIYWPYHSDNI